MDAKKSAEASITSIANLKELNPHAIQQKNKNASNPKIMLPAKRYYYLLINSYYPWVKSSWIYYGILAKSGEIKIPFLKFKQR